MALSRCMLMMRLVSSTARWGSLAIRRRAGHGLIEHLIVGAHVVHQADLGRSLGRDSIAGKCVLLGQLQAHHERPGHGATVGGNQAQEDMRIGQVGAFGHKDDVGEGDQTAAQSHGRAIDGGHDRDPASGHAGHDLAAMGERFLPKRWITDQLVQIAEVPTSREGAAIARDDNCPGVSVGVDLWEELCQTLVQFMVGGIEVVGSVQTNHAHRSVDHDLELQKVRRSGSLEITHRLRTV